MKKHTLRRIGAGMSLALAAGGLIVGLPETATASVTAVTYTCAGATTDTASIEQPWFQAPIYRNSAQTLQLIASTLNNGFSPTPSLQVTVDSTSTPSTVGQGAQIPAAFEFSALLPASLVTAAGALNVSAVGVSDATFNVNAIGATPSNITGVAPYQQVALVAGAKVKHTITGAINPTVGPGNAVIFKAGNASIKITMNVQLLAVTIYSLSLNCTPTDTTVGLTAITGAGTTAAPTTAAPTTAAPTTAAPTTAAPTTAAPTTAAPTTAAPTTAAPTTAAPTTAAPTTAAPTTAAPTTVVPQPGVDTANVRISGGYNYQNSGAVSGAGFSVSSDDAGIAAINGFGTLPGKNGGTASVSVSVNRFLWWSFGSITVNDSGAGINGVEAPLIFAPTPSGTKASASVSAGWFTFADGFKSYTIDLTVGDNG